MWAIIETGGKQFRVEKGDVLKVEKIKSDKESSVVFDSVLLLSRDKEGKEIVLGNPYLKGVSAAAKILETGKEKKITVFKYKPKKRYRVKRGHRQEYTKVEITAIEG